MSTGPKSGKDMAIQPCPSSWAVSKAFPHDVIACPTCGKPVCVKLMGGTKWPGRYVGIPKHTRVTS